MLRWSVSRRITRRRPVGPRRGPLRESFDPPRRSTSKLIPGEHTDRPTPVLFLRLRPQADSAFERLDPANQRFECRLVHSSSPIPRNAPTQLILHPLLTERRCDPRGPKVPVDPRPPRPRPQNWLTMSDTFCPPNPKLFDRQRSTFFSRAWFGM